MSTFEIVRGVDGDCLVLDGTRICGPKPWGGGHIINTFRTDGIYEVIDKDECRKLMAENAKLRELVRDVYALHWNGLDCTECPWFDECDTTGGCPWLSILADHMRELGVEVDE